MRLWLDDLREPWKHGALGYEWVTTAADAIYVLQSRDVEFASLDHDLAWEHYPAANVERANYKEDTGMAVLEFLEREPHLWPKLGVRIHTMNPAAKPRMEAIVYKHYGRLFHELAPWENE